MFSFHAQPSDTEKMKSYSPKVIVEAATFFRGSSTSNGCGFDCFLACFFFQQLYVSLSFLSIPHTILVVDHSKKMLWTRPGHCV